MPTKKKTAKTKTVTVRAVRSFCPADAPALAEGDVREVTREQAAAYAPHVEEVD